MKKLHPTRAIGTLAVAALLTSATASALEMQRQELIQAPGACAASVPTDDVRNRVGGVRNAGTIAVYVICAMPGDWYGHVNEMGASRFGILLRNTGTATANAQCILHGGLPNTSTTTDFGSFSQTENIGPGSSTQFQFDADDYLDPGVEFPNPTIICKLNQKVEVVYMYRMYDEPIGT
jgi:hypothetical protein